MATVESIPGQLRQLAADLWQVPSEVRQPGGVRMPVNMTLIRVPSGLALVSPVAIDDMLAEQIATLGEVRELVSPSCLHHRYLDAAHKRWPAARVLAPPGLATKRPELHIDAELPGSMPEGWRGHLDAVVVGGAPKLGETVLFHRASATLVCADLVFNIKREPYDAPDARAQLARALSRMAGALPAPART